MISLDKLATFGDQLLTHEIGVLQGLCLDVILSAGATIAAENDCVIRKAHQYSCWCGRWFIVS